MTYLNEVLRRCITTPDTTNIQEKSVCGENRCWSEAAIAMLLSCFDLKWQQKVQAISGAKDRQTATLIHFS
jgi:hypothetical protein